MPGRIPKPCRKTACPGTTTERNGYCSEHQGAGSNWSRWQEHKGNSSQRGYGSKWRKLREQILERDFYLCRECMRKDMVREGSHVDHIKPKAQGGTDSPDNLQTLCATCHGHKTATERKGGAG